MSPTAIRSLAVLQARAIGVARHGSCTTSVIGMCYGPRRSVEVQMRIQVIRAWAQHLRGHLEAEHDMRRVWPGLLLRCGPTRGRWRAARGPASAALATLYDAGWVPITPAQWISLGGQAVLCGYDRSAAAWPGPVKGSVASATLRMLAARVAKSEGGEGGRAWSMLRSATPSGPSPCEERRRPSRDLRLRRDIRTLARAQGRYGVPWRAGDWHVPQMLRRA